MAKDDELHIPLATNTDLIQQRLANLFTPIQPS